MSYTPIKTPSEALRRFEQQLIPVRTVAGNEECWRLYQQDMLPDLAPDKEVAIHQGFSAGYDAAMAQVRRILTAVQTESLRRDA